MRLATSARCGKLRTENEQAVSDSSKTCRRVILLSGTPALNRPVELFPQVNMISNVLGSWTEYTKQHCGAKKGRFGWEYRGAENLPELHKKLQKVYNLHPPNPQIPKYQSTSRDLSRSFLVSHMLGQTVLSLHFKACCGQTRHLPAFHL
jgi:hypothetical protein